jgi:hypothetical protein
MLNRVRRVLGMTRLLVVGSVVIAGCSVFPLSGLTGGHDAADAAPDVAFMVDAAPDGATADAWDGALDAGSDAFVDPTDSPAALEAGGPDASPTDSAAPIDAPAEAAVESGPLSYEDTVLSDSPLAYWRVDESSGTVAHDITGNGNDATYTGGVTLGSSGALLNDSDTAVTLDGTTG